MAVGLRLPPHQRPKRKSVSFLPRLFCLQGALFLLTHFRKPCCGLDLWSGEEPLGAGAGTPDPPVSPATEPSTLPSDVLLGRSLSGYATRLVSGSQDSRPGANHSWGPPFGGQTRTSLRHCFVRSFPQQPPQHTPRQPDPALQLTQREEPAVPRERDRQTVAGPVGRSGREGDGSTGPHG